MWDNVLHVDSGLPGGANQHTTSEHVMKKNTTKIQGTNVSENQPKPAPARKIAQNQKVLVSEKHSFHPNKVGYFQFLGGPNGDTAVLTEKPLTGEGQVGTYFAVSPADVQVVI